MRLDPLQNYIRDSRRKVYFIRSTSGHIKIGSAIDPEKRLAELQVANPEPLTLIGTCVGGRVMEKALHRDFAAHRVMREWFHPAPELLQEIRDLTSL